MVGKAGRAVLLGLVTWTAAGCTAPEKAAMPVYDPAAYSRAVPVPSPSPAFAWSNGSHYAIVVRKRERSLTLYLDGNQVKVYPVVLGMAPLGRKLYQGDLRTPEGVYQISGKRTHERWARFMLLSYPNYDDRERYRTAVDAGQVPMIDGYPPGLGGAVGIHGTDRYDANVRGVDWTLGCVSLFNEHVSELYDRVPVGTPVLIEE
jgi:murein L,D-transpeptidase YafK